VTDNEVDFFSLSLARLVYVVEFLVFISGACWPSSGEFIG
jgi:hypothetical protein